MIKTAQLAEMSIVYGNRYRSHYSEVDKGLYDAEKLFFKGNYKDALDVAVKACSVVDSEIHKKLLYNFDK